MAHIIQRLPLTNAKAGDKVAFQSSIGQAVELVTVKRVTQTAVVADCPNPAGQLYECRFRKGDGAEFGDRIAPRRIWALDAEGVETMKKEPRRQELIRGFLVCQWFTYSVQQLEILNEALLKVQAL